MDLASDSSAILGSLWIYPVGAVFVMLSALIPPIPSTTVFVALGAVAGLDGGPKAVLLVAAMMVGALAGDLATYWLTKLFGHTKWGTTRGPRRQRAVDAATRRLQQRPYMFILTSRFIPLGRLSSNIAATVAGFPLRSFVGYSLMSALVWSLYSVGVGICTRFWPGISTQAAVIVAIIASIILGWLLGKVSTWFLDRKNSKQAAAVAS
ncbi:DedA family protein [Arthrobacter sp. GMC3]|uniref:DedA family protein n=1 Tax=Arthrobacter sp. GMC3 TaxID=2058894 RepID=UPI0015E43DA9|nr:VTT domain-containing protein [Arthrobacter sp. GMC3]